MGKKTPCKYKPRRQNRWKTSKLYPQEAMSGVTMNIIICLILEQERPLLAFLTNASWMENGFIMGDK